MPGWLTWLLGLVLVTGESAVLAGFGVSMFAVQMGVVVTVLLGLRREFIPGALTLAALLPVIEWYAGGPKGFYGFGLAVVFIVMQIIRPRLHQQWGLMHVLAGALAATLHPLVVVGVLAVFQSTAGVGHAILWAIPWCVLGVTLALWPAQWLLERADSVFEGNVGKRVFD